MLPPLASDPSLVPAHPLPITSPGHTSGTSPPSMSEQLQKVQSNQGAGHTQPVSHSAAAIASPPIRNGSPRPHRPTAKHKKSSRRYAQHLPNSLLDGTVPPIEVLIVEDNIINLKLLEAFMKRLKVRWQTAMNGKEAVTKWRKGGFHLVLMDIQLPVMNGLNATREIRRLERVNNIGVFSKSTHSYPFIDTTTSEPDDVQSPGSPEDDVLDKRLFKSPVIIVALTASSLQSDRHEALAAGCNDFLTKPVNMVWLEQKVTEWGSMQALIDYEGWCKWRGYEQNPVPPNPQADQPQTSSTAPVTPASHKRSTRNSGNGVTMLPDAQSLTSTMTAELAGVGLHEDAVDGFPLAAPPVEHCYAQAGVSTATSPRPQHSRPRLNSNRTASFEVAAAATLDPDSVAAAPGLPPPTPSIEQVVELGVQRTVPVVPAASRGTSSLRAQKSRSCTPSILDPSILSPP
ncbi:ssk1 response regulator receiver [Ascosphaera acerosa]|nr:ssk1 response regulator receiver [Ascosphaera acerosa]